jgi:hypothetical protein
MVSNQHNKDIFERLRNGETISSIDPEAYKLREASFATKALLVQLNNSADPAETRDLLSKITGSEIDDSVVVFTPLYITGRIPKSVRTSLSTSIVSSLI